VRVYSDWVSNAKCIVGTAHMLKTKPGVLWVHNASYIVGASGNHTTATLALVCETLQPVFCTVAHKTKQPTKTSRYLKQLNP